MRTTNKRKNMLSVLAAAVMLMTALLTACGSGQEAVTSTQAEASKVETETAKAEETAPAAPTETKEAEPTAEPTEPAPEPVVYEGIDMESTLPGVEWIKTFDGVIEEPKMVIFNDETNKKVIVENGQKVKKGDKLMEIDLDYIKAHAPSLCTPVLCTELSDNQKILILADGAVKAVEPLFAIDTYEKV